MKTFLRSPAWWIAFGLGLAQATSLLGQDSFADDVTARPQSTARTQPPPPPPAVNPSPAIRPQPVAPTAATEISPDQQPRSASSKFARVTALETEDFGIAPTSQLRGDPLHAPTPTRIEGGSVVTTEALVALLQNRDTKFIVFDVLGGERGLPGAQNAQPAGSNGSFNDSTQRDFGNYLRQVTQGNKDIALIFYCQNVQCWRSYNAALRAINLGFSRVLWYRGGIEAWTQAGLPTVARQ